MQTIPPIDPEIHFKMLSMCLNNIVSIQPESLADLFYELDKDQLIRQTLRTLYQTESISKALRNAASKAYVRIIEIMIPYIEDIDAKDDNPESKRTALHWAVINKHPEVIQLLIAHHALSDIEDANKKTATYLKVQFAIY